MKNEVISKILKDLERTNGRISHHRGVIEQKALFYDRSLAAGSPRMGEPIDMPTFQNLRDQGLIIMETDSPELRVYKISDAGVAAISN